MATRTHSERNGVENHVFTCAGCGRQWTVVSDSPLDCFFLGLCQECIWVGRLTNEAIRGALTALMNRMRDRRAVERACETCGIPKRYEHECTRADIPIPKERIEQQTKRRMPQRQSAWPGFFERWQPGDSVVVSWTALASMQSYAKWMGQRIFWKQVPESKDDMAAARVWRVM